MAHKTLIGGTAYEISGGKTLVGGTAYKIGKGKTLVGGTAHEITFVPSSITVNVTGSGSSSGSHIALTGTYITGNKTGEYDSYKIYSETTVTMVTCTEIYVYVYVRSGTVTITIDGVSVDTNSATNKAEYAFVPSSEVVNINLSSKQITITTS